MNGNSQGFTLIEVLLAIALMGITFGALTQLQGSNMVTNARAIQLNDLDKAGQIAISLLRRGTLTAVASGTNCTAGSSYTCTYEISNCALNTANPPKMVCSGVTTPTAYKIQMKISSAISGAAVTLTQYIPKR
jgi:prepilin-type N-terminal cleavage/methylation domain-containing protein